MRRYMVIVLSVMAFGCVSVADASARTLGTATPRTDCKGYGLSGINTCRRAEGIGPLHLPSNFNRLSAGKQLFVVINLERVNRGLAPISVLLAPLDTLATRGAQAGTDPQFPTEGGANGYFRGGGIWASDDPPSLLEADVLWMYQDSSSAWGHRHNILISGTDVVGGGGATRDNWDFEMLSGFRYSSREIVFRWSSELKYFSSAPRLEPL